MKQTIEIEIDVPDDYERLPEGTVIEEGDEVTIVRANQAARGSVGSLTSSCLIAFRRKKRLVGYLIRIVDSPIPLDPPGLKYALGIKNYKHWPKNKDVANWLIEEPDVAWVKVEEVFE